jgi:PDZ domain-containing protein
MVVFVLNQQVLAPIVDDVPSLRRQLPVPVPPPATCVPPARRPPAGPLVGPRPSGLSDAASDFLLLTSGHPPAHVLVGVQKSRRRRLGRRGRWCLALGAAAVVTAAGFLYRPPVVLVEAGDPIDITADITIEGTAVHPVSGRYVITWVRVERPTVFTLGRRLLQGHAEARWQHAVDPALLDAGRHAFTESRETAVLAAARAAGLVGPDGRPTFSVRFRDRALTGPSAGLVYALAVLDRLEPGDLTGGRVIAATGTITVDGRVGVVGGLAWKSEGAARVQPALFLVPASQVSAARGTGRGVRTLADAVAALRAG